MRRTKGSPLCYNRSTVCRLYKEKTQGRVIMMSMNDIHSLSHSKWNCKYHIVFTPKYRRKVFFGEKKREIGKILQLKYKYRSKEFWCKGYYVDTIGKKQKGYANTFRINCVKISWENSYPSIPKTRLRVAGNNPTQLADRTYVFYTCAKNGGLCPHMKNHAFYAWFQKA